jgi:hypothetical protein
MATTTTTSAQDDPLTHRSGTAEVSDAATVAAHGSDVTWRARGHRAIDDRRLRNHDNCPVIDLACRSAGNLDPE